MRVLWICNIILPVIGKKLGNKVPPYGGWLSGMANSLSQIDNIELIVLFGWQNKEQVSGAVDGIKYLSYNETGNDVDTFKEILTNINPDLIHIWGTEAKHSLDMMEASRQMGLADKTIVNIQGLISIYGKYHYFAHLPYDVVASNRLVELRYGHRIKDDRDSMLKEAESEIKTIQLAKNVIGRTDWDEACTKQINPIINYYHCNETLRSTFYVNKWDFETCEKHSIFVSQSNWPLKGFHIALEALPLILKQYPDTKLYVTGESPIEWYKSKHYSIRQRSYPRYLAKFICKNNLEDSVVFLSQLNEQEMCERYLKSNVFVSPSSIENSSNSIGEAMLLGMPVVSSDVGGVKNFMEHEKEGYLYQSDAPYMLAYYVCKVFEDENRAREMGQNANKRAQVSYDRDKNLNTMIDIYKKLVENK